MAIDITFLNNNSTANITTNFERVEAALEQALSRTGNAPNQMNADLDLNDYNIINVGEILPGSVSSLNYVTYAAEWANKAEDSLVSADAGGDGVDDYSAKHWSAKAEAQATLAADQVALATTQANNAAASYDQFDDRYLGTKAADPTLDNDGDALVAGALYFNTTSGAMRVYDGTDWGDIANTVSRDLYEYTATAGQTVFSGADRHGNSLSTGNKFLNVHLNGARLTPTDDYTWTAAAVTLVSPVNSGDEVLIEALNTFEITNSILSVSQVLTDGEKTQARANIEAASEADITRVENALGGYRNKIINGNFDIWQRATSQTSSGYGSADRWDNKHNGSTKTTSKQDFTLGQTDVVGEPTSYLRTIVNSASGAANYVQTNHNIEGVKTLSGKTATLTFYAKADATKDISIDLLQVFGTGGSPSAAVAGIGQSKYSLTTAWQKFSAVISIPSIAGKTLGTNNDDHLRVRVWFDAGSDYDASTGTLGQQSGTFDIARVSVVEGDATQEYDPFSPRHIGQETALCQRYYWKTEQRDYRTGGTVNGDHGLSVSFPTVMRTDPAIILSSINYALNSNSLAPSVVTADGFLPVWSSGDNTIHSVVQFAYEADAEI